MRAPSGPFTAVRAFGASADERARALHRWRALAVLEELTREAKSGDRGALVRLLALLPSAPAFADLGRVPTLVLAAPIERALEREQLLLVPGWEWARTPVLPRPPQAPPAASDVPPASAPRPRSPAPRTHELLFEYVTNTGHFITDDHGFELKHPSGSVEKGKLSSGRLQRKGVEPGAYELRTRSLRSARWSTTSAAPFEPVELLVTTRGFPDGTRLDLVIRAAHGTPGAPGTRLQAEVKSDRAVARWAFEQAVGERAAEQLQFEAATGKKRARSGLLTIAPHSAGTPRGAQERLRERGYDPGAPADAVTAPLRSALQRFQKDHPPLVASGDLDAFTIDLLDDPFA